MEYYKDLLVGIQATIQRSYDSERNVNSLMARIEVQLPKNSKGVTPILSYGSKLKVLGQVVGKDSAELSAWKSFPDTVEGASGAREWLKSQKRESLRRLKIIKAEYLEHEEASKLSEYSEYKI